MKNKQNWIAPNYLQCFTLRVSYEMTRFTVYIIVGCWVFWSTGQNNKWICAFCKILLKCENHESNRLTVTFLAQCKYRLTKPISSQIKLNKMELFPIARIPCTKSVPLLNRRHNFSLNLPCPTASLLLHLTNTQQICCQWSKTRLCTSLSWLFAIPTEEQNTKTDCSQDIIIM